MWALGNKNYAHESSKVNRGLGSPWAGAARGCKPLDVGTGNWTVFLLEQYSLLTAPSWIFKRILPASLESELLYLLELLDRSVHLSFGSKETLNKLA